MTKKKVQKKPVREKVCGEPNKVMPAKNCTRKKNSKPKKSNDTLWTRILRKLGFKK